MTFTEEHKAKFDELKYGEGTVTYLADTLTRYGNGTLMDYPELTVDDVPFILEWQAAKTSAVVAERRKKLDSMSVADLLEVCYDEAYENALDSFHNCYKPRENQLVTREHVLVELEARCVRSRNKNVRPLLELTQKYHPELDSRTASR